MLNRVAMETGLAGTGTHIMRKALSVRAGGEGPDSAAHKTILSSIASHIKIVRHELVRVMRVNLLERVVQHDPEVCCFMRYFMVLLFVLVDHVLYMAVIKLQVNGLHNIP